MELMVLHGDLEYRKVSHLYIYTCLEFGSEMFCLAPGIYHGPLPYLSMAFLFPEVKNKL
jgi:hypothetical protein